MGEVYSGSSSIVQKNVGEAYKRWPSDYQSRSVVDSFTTAAWSS